MCSTNNAMSARDMTSLAALDSHATSMHMAPNESLLNV